MNILAIAVACLLSVVAICALSAFVGRQRNTRTHRIAFYAGVVGLLAVPTWLIAAAALSLQIPYLRLATPAGVSFAVSAIAMLSASFLSLIALLSFKVGPDDGPNSSSKRTREKPRAA
jgi:hypothetical protein